MKMTIRAEEPTSRDVAELLAAHLAFSRAASPADHVHALDLKELSTNNVSFFVARAGSELLGVGALRDLDGGRGEIKSMHTSTTARGRGVGRALLGHLISTARDREMTWLGLETGSMDEFAPARDLYQSSGFVPCEPFGSYTRNPFSMCMGMNLVVFE